MMFGSILRKYEKFRKDHEEEEVHISQLIRQETEYLTKHYLQVHNRRVIDIHKTQQNIDQRSKGVASRFAAMSRISSQWVDIYYSLNKVMKEVGDLVNYSDFIQKALDEIILERQESPQTPLLLQNEQVKQQFGQLDDNQVQASSTNDQVQSQPPGQGVEKQQQAVKKQVQAVEKQEQTMGKQEQAMETQQQTPGDQSGQPTN